MREQTVMWTALPQGVAVAGSTTVLKLSVFVSVRLKTNEGKTLAQFPDFVNWPETLFPPSGDSRPAAQFFVQFANSSTLIGANRLGALPRADLWTALFTSSTPLQSHKFEDLSTAQVLSYPVKNVNVFLKGEYAKAGKVLPSDSEAIPLPPSDQLLSMNSLGQIAFLKIPNIPGPDETQLLQAYNSELKSKRTVSASSTPNPAQDFFQLKQFHKLANLGRTPKSVLRPAQQERIKKFDFHQMVAALGGYGGTPEQPGLLRLLGLVHDLQIPFPGELGSTSCQVIVTWTPRVANSATFQTINVPNAPPALPARKLMTKCIVSSTGFSAEPRPGSKLSGGMLDLSDTAAFEVVQIDPDGGGLKLLEFANTVKRSFYLRRTADTALEHTFPALRSGGLSVARVNRPTIALAAFAVFSQLNLNLKNQQDSVLYADDLVRGYRVDAWNTKLGWKSLCRRAGTYSIPSAQNPQQQVTVEDEGFVSTALTKALDVSSNKRFLHDALFRWTGWSLVVPRPGNTIAPEDPTDPSSPPVMPRANKPPTALNPHLRLETRFTVPPGTLPSLRYGVAYRLRARAVDLAGNSLPYTLTGFTNASPQQTYARFEPIPSPLVVKRHPNTKGETLERVVIRSNWNTAAATTLASERHIAPPKVSQLMAEHHGLFDVPDPNNATQTILSTAAYLLIAQKDGGDFLTAPGAAVDPNDYKLNPQDPQNTGASQPYFDVPPPLALPYLPDPFSQGAAFHTLPQSTPRTVETHRGLPGVTAFVYGPPGVSFYRGGAVWSDAKPFLLRVVEGPSSPPPPDWQPDPGILTVFLPKAWVARVRYSSFPDGADLSKMGLFLWATEAGLSPTEQEDLRTRAIRGLHWMLTPFRELTLVHAVRQPLKALSFTSLHAERALGQTFATIVDGSSVVVDGKSTSKIAVKAAWQEPVDAPKEPTWRTIAAKAEAFEVPVVQTDTHIMLSGRHEFGDTKFRKVTYRFFTATRFREYFDLQQSNDVTLTGTSQVVLDADGVAEGSEVVKKADLSQQYVRDQDYVMSYGLGRIARIAGGAIADGQTVHVDYELSTVRESAPQVINVPNAARPAAPSVLYVLPTFKWETAPGDTTTASKITSARRGRGLRIYLERPWWSSGDGELLGVVLWPGSTSSGVPPTVPDKLRPYVTQWGVDPIWKAGATSALPTLAAFKLATSKKTGLSLDELANVDVSVAGHAVGFDEQRRLWYCDIEIDAGASSYFPFVRLALARFQPNSVSGAHLSRVVLADFAQLTPDRSATLTFASNKPTSVSVALSGVSYASSAAGSGPGVVEASVEERLAGVEGDLGWVPVPGLLGRPVPLLPQPGTRGTTQWAGQVTLPAARGSRPFRLVIREFERYRPAAGQGLVRRLVYADALEI
ncbi:MAG: hypothetical protein HYU88_09075 [Chloroflexi bacterium]|nr:hypothetical protein [Chloroflexota bacterium]